MHTSGTGSGDPAGKNYLPYLFNALKKKFLLFFDASKPSITIFLSGERPLISQRAKVIN